MSPAFRLSLALLYVSWSPWLQAHHPYVADVDAIVGGLLFALDWLAAVRR